MAVIGFLAFVVVGYFLIFIVFWRNIYHLRVKAQVRDLSMEMISVVHRLAGRHSRDLAMRLGKYRLSLVHLDKPVINNYNFDVELAEFFVTYIQSDSEYLRLRNARKALMDHPKVDRRLLYPTFAQRIVDEADMLDVFRRWCKDNVTPHAGATYDTIESGIYPYPPFERTGPESLLLYYDRRKWVEIVQRWDGCNAGAVITAGMLNRRIEKPW